jgi:hypothetical protein
VLALAWPEGGDCLVSLSQRPVPVVRVWNPDTADLRCEFPLRQAGNELAVIGPDLLLQAEGHFERWRLDPARAERQVVWSQPESSGLLSLHTDRQTVFGEHERHLISIDVDSGRLLRRWTDPRSGRTVLFVGVHACEIPGMTLAEGRMLLADLLEHATRREHVYQHRWAVGDLVMWDNTTTVHRGRWFDFAERRELRRATTEEVQASAEALAA